MTILLTKTFKSFHEKRSFARSYGIFYVTIACSGYRPSSISSFAQTMRHAFKLLKNVSILFAALRDIVSDVDDVIDELSPEEFLNAGKIHLGKNPSPFIENRNVVSDEVWHIWRRLDNAGVMPIELTILYANLLAYAVEQEKLACFEGRRDDAAKAHVALSAVCGCNSATLVNPLASQFLADLNLGTSFTIEKLRELMPSAYALGTVVQIHDDLTDLCKDVVEEANTNIISPNFVFNLCTQRGERKTALDYFSSPHMPEKQFIARNVLPSVIKDAWLEARACAYQEAKGIKHDLSRRCIHTMLDALPGPFSKPFLLES
ncbi:MAG: hypothetical protein LJE96_21430 [Deltaproteobacteria bacterium]|jgi:hypothetical protein|nr:hypothetical protein [Deltaproteobacteria bacterium]